MKKSKKEVKQEQKHTLEVEIFNKEKIKALQTDRVATYENKLKQK